MWFATARACRVPGPGRTGAFGGLLGALPGFFVGMACCAPALTVALGCPVHGVLLTAVRSWFVPVVVVVLVATLLRNAHRADRVVRG